MGQNLLCWCSDIQNTRLSYAHTSYCWSYCTAVTFTSSIIFILTAQLDHRKGIQESCLLPLRQLLLLIWNIKGLGRTCSGQRQCWEQISDLHIFADLYFCSSLPVMSSGVLYKQCIPVHPPASSAGETGAQFCRTEFRGWPWGVSAAPKTMFREGETSTKALPQSEKGNGKWVCYIYNWGHSEIN